MEALPDVTRLSKRVLRVLGQNPGKFTLQGTNTYIIGDRAPYILIDTGDGATTKYGSVLKTALRDLQKEDTSKLNTPLVSDIIVTHKHGDHIGGVREVLEVLKKVWVERRVRVGEAVGVGVGVPVGGGGGGRGGEGRDALTLDPALEYLPPRLHKFPLPADEKLGEEVEKMLLDLPVGLYQVPPPGSGTGVMSRLAAAGHVVSTTRSVEAGVFHPLQDRQTFPLQEGLSNETLPAPALEIIHTPGHTRDSVCIYLGPPDNVLFTADSVLGAGTAVFEDLVSYLGSLKKVLEFGGHLDQDQKGGVIGAPETKGKSYQALYPGHGPVVEDGPGTIRMYIRHRMEREEEVVQVLSSSPPPPPLKNWTLWEIVKVIYKAYPESLWLAAARGVGLHLRKLEVEGRVQRLGGGEGGESEWRLLSRL